MRIIAGSARSLPLKTIEGRDTRPTTDRIKETLFNMIQHDMPGCYFLDLFAGSGQIGLECLSRGGAYAVFVENNKKAVNCIQENVAFTKFDSKSKIMNMDAVAAIHTLDHNYTFDYIFMDPPYMSNCEIDVLRSIAASSICKDDTTIIIEAKDDHDFSEVESFGYEIVREKVYKTNKHVFLRLKKKES